MTSFINLMANDIWSDHDITNRTEDMIHSVYTVQAETILNRKVTGFLAGLYQLSADEQSDLVRYSQVCKEAADAGIQARQDRDLLIRVLAVEAAFTRLEQPVYQSNLDDGQVDPQEEIDAQERAAAQAVKDGATPEELDWVYKRTPSRDPAATPDIPVSPEPLVE